MLIVVTGASGGIGFEMVKQFAAGGHSVIAVSRNAAPLLSLVRAQKLSHVTVVKADITEAEQRKKITEAIKALKLPLDALVNNAGFIVNKPFQKITEKELQSVYSTNVFGPFLLVQTLLPLFNKKVRPHIVNIGSMGGFQGSSKFPGLSAYSSSKAALASLSECLAEELKPLNISVNCLAIGAVQTEMLSKAFPGYKAPLQPADMAAFTCDFALNGHRFFNGKVLPVSSSTP